MKESDWKWNLALGAFSVARPRKKRFEIGPEGSRSQTAVNRNCSDIDGQIFRLFAWEIFEGTDECNFADVREQERE